LWGKIWLLEREKIAPSEKICFTRGGKTIEAPILPCRGRMSHLLSENRREIGQFMPRVASALSWWFLLYHNNSIEQYRIPCDALKNHTP